MDYVSLHDVLDERSGGRFAFEDDIPRIVSLGDDPDQSIIVHHHQAADIFFSHFCQSIEYRGVRTNGPNPPALLSKNIFYGHGVPPLQLVGTLVRPATGYLSRRDVYGIASSAIRVSTFGQ